MEQMMTESNYIPIALLLFVGMTAAFVSTTPPGKQVPSTTIDELSFHKILERVGKTVLRPGGSQATEKLQKWAKLTPGTTVLELSSGLGKSGIMLAETYGCKVVLTDKDDSRLEKASRMAKSKGLDGLVHTQNMDMFHLDTNDDVLALGDTLFDCAMMEASLTHFPRAKKQQVLKSIAKHTKQYLLHELCFKKEDPKTVETVKQDMEKVLKIGFYPETISSWRSILENAGFTVEEIEVGDLQALDPGSMLKDEGLVGVLNIAKNIALEPYLRSRMLATRKAIKSHSDDIGYVIMRATKC